MPLPRSGIYKITNMLNGKVYVGQSKNIFVRKRQHFDALRAGHHENKAMQHDWNVNNRGFRWDPIEFCPLDKLNEREKYWIDTLDSINRGYNAGWVPYKRTVKKSKTKKRRSK